MQEAKIVLDGVEYPVAQFSDNARKLIGIRQVWYSQVEEERLAVAKSEAAIQNLDGQLSALLKSELEASTEK